MTLRAKLLWVAVLYFAEGFPFGIVVDNLPVYFRLHGVSLVDIGLMSLLGLPWTLKVLWAPLVDRVGHARRWIAGALTAMSAVLVALPAFDAAAPGTALWALLFALTLAAATQDIAIDAYTIGLLERGEEGLANGVRVSAYRAALIVGGGGLVAVAGMAGWRAVFLLAAAMLLGLAAVAWRAPAIAVESAPRPAWLPSLRGWIARPGALAVFAFVLTYKLGDASMGPMVKPFWVDRGLSVAEIGLVSTTIGVALSVVGALCGGAFTSRVGLFRSLWILGLAQAFSNLGYAAAAAAGAGRPGIYAASALESFTGGLGTAAFLAFLMRACEKEQAATQYALLSALFGLTRTLAGAASGVATARLGYAAYFAFTFVLAFPAYLLLPWVRAWSGEDGRRAADAAT
ncbi:MAG: arabinose ABC transporter permease [Deltaproteobacteria bacterium]|nr:arabinose ABC transporter permease [Deltaproteobacteria bacterium]